MDLAWSRLNHISISTGFLFLRLSLEQVYKPKEAELEDK